MTRVPRSSRALRSLAKRKTITPVLQASITLNQGLCLSYKIQFSLTLTDYTAFSLVTFGFHQYKIFLLRTGQIGLNTCVEIILPTKDISFLSMG